MLLGSSGDDEARIAELYLLTVGREPAVGELEVVAALLERERARFAARPGDAEALISVGESPRAGSLGVVEHAAWTLAAALMLNLSETVTRG